MKDNKNFALVRKPPSAVEKAAPRTKRILSGIVADTLSLTKKFRLGEYEWCEPDYRQILLWAEQTKKNPTEIIKHLTDCGTIIRDGRMIEVKWDDGSMWVKKFSFVSGLKIKIFSALGGSYLTATLNMRRNPTLKRSDFQISEINLKDLNELEQIYISMQLLEEIDLKHTPKLKLLWCESNSLTRVNFAGCQNLEEISVRNNLLEEIDLTNLPALKTLRCNSNQLSHLDLSDVPALEFLDCRENRFLNYPMDVLDITPLNSLKVLKYDVGETRLIQRADQRF